MLVRFWGTRGSIAAPGLSTAAFGGNTSCVEVRTAETQLIFDCGTGARELGLRITGSQSLKTIHLFLTHFHWDHIQGFPFFLPALPAGCEVHIYGTAGLEQGLEEAMEGQMQYTYFPVRLKDLGKQVVFHQLGETEFAAGDFVVATQYLNHTCPTVGYRVSAGGRSVAYVTDHEPFWPHDVTLPLSETFVHPGEARHLEFVRGVDLLIHDAQYTAAEYPSRRGWGHSTIEYVTDLGLAAGVERLALYHHDPLRTDERVREVVDSARTRAAQRLPNAKTSIFAAAEGQEIELDLKSPLTVVQLVEPKRVFAPVARVALVGSEERRRLLREVLAQDNYGIVEAPSDSTVGAWIATKPDIVLLLLGSDPDATDTLQHLARALLGTRILVVIDRPTGGETLRRISEFASDVLFFPVNPQILRARVRAAVTRREPSTFLETSDDSSEPLHLLDRLPLTDRNRFLSDAGRCTFETGETMFFQGAPAGGVYYIQKGLVRITIAGAEGSPKTIGYAGPGDTVGEMAALDGAPRSAGAVVEERVEASYIPREVFLETLEQSPSTAVRMMRLLVRRLRGSDQLLSGTVRRASESSAEAAVLV